MWESMMNDRDNNNNCIKISYWICSLVDNIEYIIAMDLKIALKH